MDYPWVTAHRMYTSSIPQTLPPLPSLQTPLDAHSPQTYLFTQNTFLLEQLWKVYYLSLRNSIYFGHAAASTLHLQVTTMCKQQCTVIVKIFSQLFAWEVYCNISHLATPFPWSRSPLTLTTLGVLHIVSIGQADKEFKQCDCCRAKFCPFGLHINP
jgi:hypothetical protein